MDETIIKAQLNKKPQKEHSEDLIGFEKNVFWLLDGATMPKELSSISVVEYTKNLSNAIRKNAYLNHPQEILKKAIVEMKREYKNSITDINPSSTVIIVCFGKEIEYGVLGDSTLYIVNGDEEIVVTDRRLQNIANKERIEFQHNSTLENRKKLIIKENEYRNQKNGYYIAEFNPIAAQEMICGAITNANQDVLLMSDGLSVLHDKYNWSYRKILEKIKTNSEIIKQLREIDSSDDASFLYIKGENSYE